MRGFFKELKADKTVFRFYLATFFIILLTVGVIIFDFGNLPPILPLFNQLPWGTARLAKNFEIFIPSLLVLGILIVNIIISTLVYKRTPLVARMLSVTAFLISLLTLMFIVRTIQIVL